MSQLKDNQAEREFFLTQPFSLFRIFGLSEAHLHWGRTFAILSLPNVNLFQKYSHRHSQK